MCGVETQIVGALKQDGVQIFAHQPPMDRLDVLFWIAVIWLVGLSAAVAWALFSL